MSCQLTLFDEKAEKGIFKVKEKKRHKTKEIDDKLS